MLIGNKQFDFRSGRVYVMGILNVTPDSFSDGGRFADPEAALNHVLKLEEEGADLIDVGAESTRSGALPVPENEELGRLVPVLRKILPRLKIPVSVDTRKARVADAALLEGAAMLNDVSALRAVGMADVVARHRAPVILMHMRGEPETMQQDPSYEDVVREVCLFLEERMRFCAENGIEREKILIDPGLGFGKRFEDNLALMSGLPELGKLGVPVVVGASRKSFLRKLFGEDEKGLFSGSAAAAALAASRGASIIRAHDVAAARAAIRLAIGRQFP